MVVAAIKLAMMNRTQALLGIERIVENVLIIIMFADSQIRLCVLLYQMNSRLAASHPR
jgi:hypothetical protein